MLPGGSYLSPFPKSKDYRDKNARSVGPFLVRCPDRAAQASSAEGRLPWARAEVEKWAKMQFAEMETRAMTEDSTLLLLLIAISLVRRNECVREGEATGTETRLASSRSV